MKGKINTENGFSVTLSDGVNTHTVTIPKRFSNRVFSILETVEMETQGLTPEQEKAISERYDPSDKDKQPF